MRKFLFALFLFSAPAILFAQGTYVPLGNESYSYISRLDIKYGHILPVEITSDKGYERSKVAKVAETLLLSNLTFSKIERAQLQYLIDENAEWLDSMHSHTKRPLFKKLYTEPASFYTFSTKKRGIFDFRVNPVVGLSAGGETGGGGRFLYWRAVGLEFRGNLKKVFSFYFNATSNSERTPEYVSRVIYPGTATYTSGTYSYGYVPGFGSFTNSSSRLLGFNDGVNYFDARGYVKANILKFINLSFGRDKFFIGDGMRSLILSDFSAPYLFLKFDVNFWRIKYENIFAQLVSQYTPGSGLPLPVKYMAVHHLSVDAAHWLTLGLFETVIYQRDEPDLSYVNPIIFYKAVEASLGNPDKVSIGGDMKIDFVDHVQIYGQGLLNEFNFHDFFSHNGWWGNKWAIQFGVKYMDILPKVDAQFEFNVVRPFTYTANTYDNFTNYNQPLADPLGANFYEFIFNLHYQPLPKLSFNAKYFIAKVGTDTILNGALTNYGSEIILPVGAGSTNYITQVYNNRVGQGAHGTINYFELLTTYQPWHNINFDLSLLYRSQTTIQSPNNPLGNQSSFMFNFGVRLNINRRTFEF